jgi:hypothetical protein
MYTRQDIEEEITFRTRRMDELDEIMMRMEAFIELVKTKTDLREDEKFPLADFAAIHDVASLNKDLFINHLISTKRPDEWITKVQRCEQQVSFLEKLSTQEKKKEQEQHYKPSVFLETEPHEGRFDHQALESYFAHLMKFLTPKPKAPEKSFESKL